MRRLVVTWLLVASAAHAGKVAPWTAGGAQAGDLAPSIVHGKLTGTVATLTARYLVEVDAGYGPNTVSLALPERALVTSATATRDGTTHRLELLAAKDADDRFAALTTEPGPSEAPSAVLIAGSAGQVTIGIASPHPGVMSIVLEMSAPTCFFRDARYLGLPASWTKLDTELRTRVVKPGQVIEACAIAADPEERVLGFPARELATRPSGERLGGTAGRLALGTDHVVRVELDLAAALSEIPRDLATVILVDTSRSMSASELEVQRELALSYLREAPESRIQVIAFARTARSLLPAWSIASQALPRLQRELEALAPRNGSNFDAGLAEAGRWLSRVEGTRRVVLITDEQFAEQLAARPPASFRALLPPDTLVHVVATDPGGTAIQRDDETLLAPLATSTEGLAVRLGAIDQHAVDATMLLRPIELAHVTVSAPGWKMIKPDDAAHVCGGDPSDNPDALGEGTACTWWGQGTAVSGPISIAGLVWNKRVTRVLRPDPAQARGVARELSALHTLDETAQLGADAAAHAVNDQWSLFARWGGHGSYGENLVGGGTSGCGCIDGTIGTGTIGGGAFDGIAIPKLDLRAQLEAAVAACHIDRDRVDVDLEMTMLEIVDVRVRVSPRVRKTPDEIRALGTCVTEALWDATPMLPHPQRHATYAVTLGATF
jgi:hypothetical protein